MIIPMIKHYSFVFSPQSRFGSDSTEILKSLEINFTPRLCRIQFSRMSGILFLSLLSLLSPPPPLQSPLSLHPGCH